jgi:hypothetical protein
MYLQNDDLGTTFRWRLFRWRFLRWWLSRRRLLGWHFALNFNGYRLLDGPTWDTHYQLEGRRLLQADLFLSLWRNLGTVQEHR